MAPIRDLFRVSSEERYARSRLEAEITLRRRFPPEGDLMPPRIRTLLVKAQAATDAALLNDFGYADLRDLVDKVLRADPSNARALAMRAVAMAGVDELEAAIAAAEKALAIDPIAGLEINIDLRNFLQKAKGTAS